MSPVFLSFILLLRLPSPGVFGTFLSSQNVPLSPHNIPPYDRLHNSPRDAGGSDDDDTNRREQRRSFSSARPSEDRSCPARRSCPEQDVPDTTEQGTTASSSCPVCMTDAEDLQETDYLQCGACGNEICKKCIWKLASRCAGSVYVCFDDDVEASPARRAAAIAAAHVLANAPLTELPLCPLCRAVWTNAGERILAMSAIPARPSSAAEEGRAGMGADVADGGQGGADGVGDSTPFTGASSCVSWAFSRICPAFSQVCPWSTHMDLSWEGWHPLAGFLPARPSGHVGTPPLPESYQPPHHVYIPITCAGYLPAWCVDELHERCRIYPACCCVQDMQDFDAVLHLEGVRCCPLPVGGSSCKTLYENLCCRTHCCGLERCSVDVNRELTWEEWGDLWAERTERQELLLESGGRSGSTEAFHSDPTSTGIGVPRSSSDDPLLGPSPQPLLPSPQQQSMQTSPTSLPVTVPHVNFRDSVVARTSIACCIAATGCIGVSGAAWAGTAAASPTAFWAPYFCGAALELLNCMATWLGVQRSGEEEEERRGGLLLDRRVGTLLPPAPRGEGGGSAASEAAAESRFYAASRFPMLMGIGRRSRWRNHGAGAGRTRTGGERAVLARLIDRRSSSDGV